MLFYVIILSRVLEMVSFDMQVRLHLIKQMSLSELKSMEAVYSGILTWLL